MRTIRPDFYQHNEEKAKQWFRREFKREPNALELKTATSNLISARIENFRRNYKIPKQEEVLQRILFR